MAVSTEVDEEKETFVKESRIQEPEKTTVKTQQSEDSTSEDTRLSLALSVSPLPETEVACVSQQTTGSSIPIVADEPNYESLLTVSLASTDRKPEVERLFSDRKLVVVRSADIERSRSADIFRPDNVCATSVPALARAQSETRDVTNYWNALTKTDQTLALENLASLTVRAAKFSVFKHL